MVTGVFLTLFSAFGTLFLLLSETALSSLYIRSFALSYSILFFHAWLLNTEDLLFSERKWRGSGSCGGSEGRWWR